MAALTASLSPVSAGMYAGLIVSCYVAQAHYVGVTQQAAVQVHMFC